MSSNKIGIIILAAGSSSRLGQAKQLLKFKEKTLLEISLHAAHGSMADQMVLVLGANLNQIQQEINLAPYEVVINNDWNSGMASSIQTGLRHLLHQQKFDAVILMISDQPFIEPNTINSLINKYLNSKKGIITSTYQDTFGVPVLFDQKYFNELLELKSKEGAKKIIYKHLDDIEKVDFPKGAVDIDTPEDYAKLINSQ